VKAFESVRCLSCGNAYAKPTGRGTAAANPGCPECGYLGWLPFSSAEGSLHHHSGEDRRQRPLA
jgi:predicted  nucleic acid-binding Zn-ribbon protein